MAYKKVSFSNVRYVKYGECTPHQVIAEGRYVGSRTDKTYGKLQYLIQQGSETVVLGSSGQLNYLMQAHVKEGNQIRVTYLGTTKMEKGKYKNKEVHQFDLEVDDSTSNNTNSGDLNNVKSHSNVSSNSTSSVQGQERRAAGLGLGIASSQSRQATSLGLGMGSQNTSPTSSDPGDEEEAGDEESLPQEPTATPQASVQPQVLSQKPIQKITQAELLEKYKRKETVA